MRCGIEDAIFWEQLHFLFRQAREVFPGDGVVGFAVGGGEGGYPALEFFVWAAGEGVVEDGAHDGCAVGEFALLDVLPVG